MAKRLLTGTHFFQGDQACAEGAIAAGCKLFAGYPITPATEISERLSWRLPETGGIFVQGADELDSLTIVIGAAWGGWKTMTATSGNGICLMQENIGFACMTETPCVIVDCMRAGPATGIATATGQGDFYQVRYGSNADYSIIALAPDSPQEMFDLTVEAFNLAETYRVPVFILADEVIAHMREKVLIPDKLTLKARKKPPAWHEGYLPWKAEGSPPVPPMPRLGDGYHMPVPGLSHSETGGPHKDNYAGNKAMVDRLYNKVEQDADKLCRVQEGNLDDAEVVLIGYGSAARATRAATRLARQAGMNVGFSRLVTLWPFPDRYINNLAKQTRKLLVCEGSMGKLSREVERAARGQADVILFSKPGVEVHTPTEILDRLKKVA
jgi:2-oxoglutarate ferredoxin oxidoreductase subunit alpha